MEGPPSVLSAILTHYAQIKYFAGIVNKDTMLEWFVLVGVDKLEHARISQLIKDGGIGDLKAARQLFVNGSWRSRGVFAGFYLLALASLIYHADQLAEKYKNDGDKISFD